MQKNKNKGYTLRKFILDIHLWLGVASAIILFLVCLSGTIYTFRHEVEEFAEPEKYHIEAVTGTKKELSEIIAATEMETKGKASRISYSDDAYKPYEVQISTSKEDKRGETFFVDPYQNVILGTGKGPTTEFFMFFFKMHRWMLLEDSVGRPIVGIATLIFVILSITGIILWIPKKYKGWKSLKPGFKIKFSANWKRINHDLHNALGIYSVLLILIMAFTGLCWSFEWYKDGLSGVLGAKVFGGRSEKKVTSVVTENSQRISLEAMAKIGATAFPYQGKTVISFPKGPDGAYELRKQNETNFNKSASDKIVVDQYSGKILKTDIFASKSLGEKIATQIKPLHTGEIYGTFSKILYFISCLFATSLPITGLFIWINKLRKKEKKKTTFVKVDL